MCIGQRWTYSQRFAWNQISTPSIMSPKLFALHFNDNGPKAGENPLSPPTSIRYGDIPCYRPVSSSLPLDTKRAVSIGIVFLEYIRWVRHNLKLNKGRIKSNNECQKRVLRLTQKLSKFSSAFSVTLDSKQWIRFHPVLSFNGFRFDNTSQTCTWLGQCFPRSIHPWLFPLHF